MFIEARNNLLALLKRRVEVLRNIGDDWCGPGESAGPSAVTCDACLDVVEYALYSIIPEAILELKLIIGPTPAGGLGFEFIYRDDIVNFVLWNSGHIEIESRVLHTYSEVDLSESYWEDLVVEINRMHFENNLKQDAGTSDGT